MNHDGEKSRRVLKTSEPRPKLNHLEVHKILAAIDDSDVSGLRDRALIALLFYNHLRLGSGLRMQPEDVFWQNERPYLRVFVRKGGDREHEIIVPCFPEAYAALIDYVEKALFPSELRGPLFRTVDQRTGNVTGDSLSARTAHFSINQHAHRAGIEREISPHEFRAAGAVLLKEQCGLP
jgi:site-specific recombinase XerD